MSAARPPVAQGSLYPASAPTHPDTAVRVNSGRLIDLVNPQVDDILMADIAVSLAAQERFTGHCPLKPTIAQHSLAVEHIVGELWAREDGAADIAWAAPGALLREALMHDAAEAYVSDLSSPAKQALRAVLRGAAARNSTRTRATDSAFDKLEDGIMLAVRERFGISNAWGDLVHEADVLAYEYESGYAGWNPYASAPDWLKRDRYIAACYGLRFVGTSIVVRDNDDGGEAAFLRRAAALGMHDA